jgi:class 3 adenylate cyclase
MGARFCGGCGMPLAPRCPACGAESQADARFCTACGSSLAAPTREDAAARKIVTIVFADLVGSTALQERLDAESVRRFMDRYYGAMRGAVEAHGGSVTQLLGDGVKAVFGAPRVVEDDALRAVRAGVEMQRAFRELASDESRAVGEVGLRVAVHTGEVVAKGESEIIGDPVNVAARLQQEAREGDVLVGESTQRLVNELVTLAPFGTFALKGRAEPVTAWRVVSLEKPAGSAATPFVGRDEELRRLTAVYDAATAAPAARLAVLLGSPGLGKSRLLDELAKQLEGRARVLTAQCNPAGGATFAPLAEALRAHLGLEAGIGDEALRAALDAVVQGGRLESRPTRSGPELQWSSAKASEGGPPRSPDDDAERALIAKGIGALLSGTPALPEEIFFVVRRLLSALAAEQPVVLAIDDVQWAEPLLLDFTEHLVQWGAGIPLLVLVAARPELRDTRSSFTTAGGLVSDVVTLGGLDAGAAMRLAANVVGADTLPAAVAGRVLATSEGNPLFLRELVRMLVNDGTLRKDGERWTLTVDLAALEMPPTIQALLAARIERLRAEERLVLERASVVGRQFSRAAVTYLLPREAQADLDLRLEALRRSELVEADAGWLVGEPALRFHHVLIRDAAYRRVLRGTRAELHARFADWLEARAGDSAPHDETIGWHLEQAHQQLRELGPLDADGRALGERAGRHLAAAGRGALARDDLEPARSLLGRALDCLDEADPARGDLALDWCEALLSAGDVGTAAGALAELGRFLTTSARLRAWHTCFTSQLAALADPKALRASAEAVVAAAEALAAAGDVAGEAKAHAVHAEALARLGEIGACEAALDKALAAARRAGDRRRANTVLSGAPLAALWGPSPVTRASGRCLDVVRVLRITQGAPAVEAVALRCQAVLETLRGRSDAARRMIASSRRLVEELGIMQRLLEVDQSAGLIELLEGDAVAAERWLRPAYEGFRAHGLGVAAAQTAALLGRALLAQGRLSEAETLSRESEALAGDDFKAAIGWRGVRAEALAGRGEHAAALELARGAVEIAAATDDLLDHADARSALAVALRAAGRREEAEREEARAAGLWEQKGATLLAERARREGARTAESPTRAGVARTGIERAGRRRVRENAATATVARLNAAISARDEGLLTAFFDAFAHVHHPTASEWGRAGFIETTRHLWRAEDLSYRLEPLATLGESLVLLRQSVSASGTPWKGSSMGPYVTEEVMVVEVDADGRKWRGESFARDHLGDAVARLYELHAELLPEGPARTRAATRARTIAAYSGPIDVERWVAAWVPDVEYVDRRTIGVGSARGIDAFRRVLESLLEAAPDATQRFDDVLALRPGAWLLRITNLGHDRSTGGAYERPYLLLMVSGADGLLTRLEQFDSERVDEALARFDELLAGSPAATPAQRQVRPNAATAHVAHLEAALAARDDDALGRMLAEEYETIDHTTGATYGRSGQIDYYRRQYRVQDLARRMEPLATLGNSLAVCRASVSGSAAVGRTFDVGAFQADNHLFIEVDAHGRRLRAEIFAANRLGDAIARLYERYAELLPNGPERTRAAATARSVAALPLVRGSATPPYGIDLAPDIEWVDHRSVGIGFLHGREALLRHFHALLELTETWAARADDVLGLRSDALLVRWTNTGTQREGGGAYERQLLQLWLFAADGLVTRWEQFDAEQETVALARFDELTRERPAVRPVPRRVRPNAATANAAGLDRAIAARDPDALPPLYSAELEVVDHTTGVCFDKEGALASYRSLLLAHDPTCRHEPLATLGDSLCLLRLSVSASGITSRRFDVGAYEKAELHLMEVDAQGRRRRGEIFGTDRLGDAVARLYERYAEHLPAGPARDRAAATARSIAASLGPFDPELYATAYAPDIEKVDHRPLATHSARGTDAVTQHLRVWLELADDLVARDDDILGLEPHALLVRRTFSGTDRRGGGAFERPFLMLLLLDATGRVARSEHFDVDREAEARARFDALTAERPALPPARRRVRPNAATANAARFEAAVATRAADAIADLFSESMETVNHSTGATYGRDGILTTFEGALASSRDFAWRLRPLASLGEALALLRASVAASGFTGDRFDVGAFERQNICLNEVDANGRCRRSEVFAGDRLRDAVTRLYERHAELLPDGPSRTRATAIARSVMTWNAPVDLERLTTSLAPSFEVVDHRILGTWSMRGAEDFRQHWRAQLDLGDVDARDHEILALQPAAYLIRRTWFGTDRGGGPYEQLNLALFVFGSDGLVTRIELFDPDRTAEALSRFDELTIEVAPPRIENAATRALQRGLEAMQARDWEGFAALFAAEFRGVDRRPLFRLELDRDQWLASYRQIVEMTSARPVWQVLATRGDRLGLARVSWKGSDLAIGPSEIDWLLLIEVDARGDHRAVVTFDLDALDAAYAELDARYAAGEGAPHARRAITIRGFNDALAARDWAALARMFAPELVWRDHRRLGLHQEGSRDEYLASLRAWVELAPDARTRTDHVLAQDERHTLGIAGWVGTREGGPFEIQFAVVIVHDSAGRIGEYHTYDLDHLEDARARYAELAAAPRTPWVANLATRAMQRAVAAWEARDWERFAAGFAPGFRSTDRRRLVRLELDREWIGSYRELLGMTTGFSAQVLATRGERLAMLRALWEGAGFSTGPSEIESLAVVEVDGHGDALAVVEFDPDDLDAAYDELDERYGATRLRPFLRARAARDWDAVAALLAPDFVHEDHRRLGHETLRGPAAYVAFLRALVDLAPDARLGASHIENHGRRLLTIATVRGTWEGGAFENTLVVVGEVDARERLRRLDAYDLEQLDEARARLQAPASAPRDPLAALVRPNAASAHMEGVHASFEARDWEALRRLAAEGARFEDRRGHALVWGDFDWLVEYLTGASFDVSLGVYQRTLVATAGDHICLERVLWTGGPADGRVEVEYLWLAEVDESGHLVSGVMFDPEDWRAATRDAWGRWLARDPASAAVMGPAIEFAEGVNDRDRDRMRAVLADDLVSHDRRRTGEGRVDGADAYLDTLAVLGNLSPDFHLQPLFVLALERHGMVSVARTFGTLPEGGPWENWLVTVATVARGRITRLELFEIEAVDAALARLGELRPDPLRIPPNAATRARDR